MYELVTPAKAGVQRCTTGPAFPPVRFRVKPGMTDSVRFNTFIVTAC